MPIIVTGTHFGEASFLEWCGVGSGVMSACNPVYLAPWSGVETYTSKSASECAAMEIEVTEMSNQVLRRD